MIPYLGGKIRLWPGAFSPTECAEIAERFTWTDHGVARDPRAAQEMGPYVLSRMPGISLTWTDQVTLSSNRVPWHKDVPLGATHKMCLYLDPGPGTEFRDVEVGAQGDIVLFDIRLEHRTGLGIGDAERPRRIFGLRANLRA